MRDESFCLRLNWTDCGIRSSLQEGGKACIVYLIWFALVGELEEGDIDYSVPLHFQKKREMDRLVGR